MDEVVETPAVATPKVGSNKKFVLEFELSDEVIRLFAQAGLDNIVKEKMMDFVKDAGSK